MLPSSAAPFTDFGPSRFLRRAGAVSILPITRDRRSVRQQLRAECPAVPGVYGMVDHEGRLIYVGVSVKLRNRLMTYFQGSWPFAKAERPRKELRISGRSAHLVWEVVGHELLALLRECELIRRFQPDLNVRDRRHRGLAFIYLSTDDAPRFRIAARLPNNCRYQWGPFGHNRHLIRSVDHLNRLFKLPDCPSQIAMRFADQREFFAVVARPHCLRGELDACLGPCAGLCSRQQYFAQLARARAFLDGHSDAILQTLRHSMAAAASRQNFERAGQLRDINADLETLIDRLTYQRPTPPQDVIYRAACGRRRKWVLIASGTVAATAVEPRTLASARTWLRMLDQHETGDPWQLATRDARESQIVSSWFKQRPEESAHTRDLPTARAYCRKLLISCENVHN